MPFIRKATLQDISRIAEILVFAKRTHYRAIFHDDAYSFGTMTVLSVAQEIMDHPDTLHQMWVYDDIFVKAVIQLDGAEIKTLYVDPFFQGEGIGTKLLSFAAEQNARWLWVLEKNEKAIHFYQTHHFQFTGERMRNAGTAEYIVKMKRQSHFRNRAEWQSLRENSLRKL